MHLTLKRQVATPSAANAFEQQERFDNFRQEFNQIRPHEALGMKTPASLFEPSARKIPEQLPALEYPLHDETVVVSKEGYLYQKGVGRSYVGCALRYQPLGLRHIETGTWLVSFMDLDLGYLDEETNTLVEIPR